MLDHCASLIEKGRMPLENYLPLHPEARLNAAQKQVLIQWLRQPLPATTPAKDSCDDPDASVRCYFLGRPEYLTSTMAIAAADEPGERLVIRGQVLKPDHTPHTNALLYAYHTDITGRYRKKGEETGIRRWHGQLHGWCQTDANGRYEISTIRPAGYPGNQAPAHIHAAVWLDGRQEPLYINDFVFADDALIDARYRAREDRERGGSGVVEIQKGFDGVWRGVRNIVLR